MNRILGRLANYLYPCYIKIRPNHRRIRIRNGQIDGKSVGQIDGQIDGSSDHSETQSNKRPIIVSLTSYPGRMEYLHLCLESLLRQDYPSYQVILWLAGNQFGSINAVPEKVRRLTKNGLIIRFCPDLRSYKKIFYTAQQYPHDIIVTADDDALYPESWLSGLYATMLKNPECVCCYRAHEMTYDDSHRIKPYLEWNGLSPDITGPSEQLVPIGVGGVLYPHEYFTGVEFSFPIIRKLCPTADDLWLKAIGMQKKIPAVKAAPNSKEWFTIRHTQNQNLMQENVGDEGKNDVALKALLQHFGV